MRHIGSIIQREMRSYFNSPVAYIVLSVFLLFVGYLYFSTLFVTGFASLRNFFSITPLLLVVFAPAITMRLIAEERKSGTIEHLLTLPVADIEVILGKFLAALFTLSIGIALTLPYVFSVSLVTPPETSLDLGPILGGYLGLILLCAAFLSLGLLASAITRNQIVAFIIGLSICFVFFFIDKFAVLLPPSLGAFFEYLSVDYHFASIARGVVDTRDLLYYASIIVFALMLSTFSLRRCRA